MCVCVWSRGVKGSYRELSQLSWPCGKGMSGVSHSLCVGTEAWENTLEPGQRARVQRERRRDRRLPEWPGCQDHGVHQIPTAVRSRL